MFKFNFPIILHLIEYTLRRQTIETSNFFHIFRFIEIKIIFVIEYFEIQISTFDFIEITRMGASKKKKNKIYIKECDYLRK